MGIICSIHYSLKALSGRTYASMSNMISNKNITDGVHEMK